MRAPAAVLLLILLLAAGCGGASSIHSAKNVSDRPGKHTSSLPNLGGKGSPLTVGQVVATFRRHGIRLLILPAPASSGAVAVATAIPSTRVTLDIESRRPKAGAVALGDLGNPPRVHEIVKNVIASFDPRGRFGARVEAALATLRA